MLQRRMRWIAFPSDSDDNASKAWGPGERGLHCIVHFNNADRAWECPCHGSRFAVDGTVIQGPANRPLPSADLPADLPGE